LISVLFFKAKITPPKDASSYDIRRVFKDAMAEAPYSDSKHEWTDGFVYTKSMDLF
jgi:hypothetical protein